MDARTYDETFGLSREQVLKDSGFENLYRSIVGW